MKIARAEVFAYRLRLDSPIPLRGRDLPERTGLLLRLESESGRQSWGEAAPLPGFSRETVAACRRKLEEALAALRSLEGGAERDSIRGLRAFRGPIAHSASYFAVESAWRRLQAEDHGVSPWHDKAPDRAPIIQLNALLAGTEERILARAQEAATQGYRAVKLKVGRDRMTDDIRVVRAVREAIGPGVALRLDANQAWSIEDAVLFGKAVAASDIAYIEEPCQQFGDLPAFRLRTGIPYAIDESIFTVHDMLRGRGKTPLPERALAGIVQEAEALVWKPTLVHTPTLGDLLFHDVAQGQSSRIVISAAFESGVGTAALANYAAMFASPDTPAGLDTYTWIAPDILRERLPLQGGAADLNAINAAAETVDTDRLTRVWAL
ncbi:MAG: o-succinylbenzoate synthase [Candidatus Hydrogenedentes bacterium]|nr:o-succinylbenzoate synthase [Candidatus Hydrogenedentota bacterium]